MDSMLRDSISESERDLFLGEIGSALRTSGSSALTVIDSALSKYAAVIEGIDLKKASSSRRLTKKSIHSVVACVSSCGSASKEKRVGSLLQSLLSCGAMVSTLFQLMLGAQELSAGLSLVASVFSIDRFRYD